jgi:alanyl aminopeptidase
MRTIAIPLALLVAACSSEPLPPPPAPPPPTAAPVSQPVEAPKPPELRLPAAAAPKRYALKVAITPGQPTFEGTIDIDLAIREPSRLLWLNGTALTIKEATLEIAGRTLAARVVPGGDHFVGFAFEEELPAAAAKLHVVYTAPISDKDDRGVFSEQDDGHSYVFTQFESIEARRAFPCFDEPSYKVPWQLALDVPAGDVALANTKVESETAAGARKIVRFAETKPLPSYLLAFAVGPFDLVDAGKAGKNGVPVRIAVQKGKGARAEAAAAITPKLIARLEALFDVPFPYDKLDVVSIPQLVSFGAMENPGLITFRARRLLATKEERTPRFELLLDAIMTHELGHHWFGDLVTTAWWDDIWLNEAFASWIESRILGPLDPSWRFELMDVRDIGDAMRGDALVNARMIRQPIASNDDIHDAFDEITYTKGFGVISMFESYVGEERFRKGLTRYLRERAHQNATASDLLAAVSAEAGQDIAPAFSTFLDRPGVPLVSVEPRCSPKDGVALSLAQERYFPVGSQGAPSSAWQVPVCVRWGRGKDEGRACTLLKEGRATLPLPAAKGCPEWVVPNDRAAGYYHAAYTAESLDALLAHEKKALTPVDRAALLRDLRALVAAGKLPIAEVFRRLPALVKDAHPQLLLGAIELVEVVPDAMLTGEERARFARFLDKTFGARARAVGWQPKPGEDQHVRMLRRKIVPLVADRGEDRALAAEAEALARRFLDGAATLDADMIDPILVTAAHRADRAFFERLRDEAKRAKEPSRRTQILTALSEIRDPALARAARELVLAGDHDPRDATALVFGGPRVADTAFGFVKDRFDGLVARLPAEWLGHLPAVGDSFCDDAHRADVESFFKPRLDKLPGGPRTLAKSVEKIRLCAALRAAQGPSLSEFLKRS